MSNRKGLGVNVQEVYRLGGDVFGIGWSDSIPDPCCITAKPGSAELLDFNKQLVASSEGRLPAVSEDQTQHFAMSCNHTVWFLKCVEAEMRCDIPALTLNGRLNLSAIEQTDSLFAKRVREGMMWLVVSWKVREYYPEIVELIIEAKNAPGEINRRTSAFEVLRQIWNLSKTCLDSDSYPDWAKIKSVIERGNPSCIAILPELVEFVVNCSGGADGRYLVEVTNMWKQCNLGNMTRTIPSKVWHALATCHVPGGDSMARFKNMCVLTTLTAEKETVEDGICGFLHPHDCEIFETRRESLQARTKLCNDVLNDGFDLIDKCAARSASSGASALVGASGSAGASGSSGASAPDATYSKLKLKFASRLVRFALSEVKNRQRPGDTFKTASAIGFELLVGVRQLCQDADSLMTNAMMGQWQPDEKDKAGKTAPPQRVRVKELTKDGHLANLEDQLNQMGLEIGDHVKSKKSSDLWVIASCDENGLVLEDLPGRTARHKYNTLQAFMTECTRPPSGYEKSLLHADPSWFFLDPQTSKAGASALAKADVLAALTVAARLHPDQEQPVQPMLNMKNGMAGVQATGYAKAGTIVLAPWTTNVIIDFPEEASFKKPAQWIVEMNMQESFLADFASEEGSPRIHLASTTLSEKVDLEAKGEKRKKEKERLEKEKQDAEKEKRKETKPQREQREKAEKAEKEKAEKAEKEKAEKAEKEKAEEERKKAADPAYAAKKAEEERKEAEEKEKEKNTPKNHLALFWRLESLCISDKKAEEINMCAGHISVDSLGTIVEQSKIIGTKNGRKPDFSISARTTRVTIPVLVNKKDVMQGDRLVYEKITVVKEEKERKPISQTALVRSLLRGSGGGDQQPQKKARTN